MMFRVGRKAKRTVYLQAGDNASDGDTIIGLVDSAEIASFMVEAANEKLLREGPRQDLAPKL